jgi:predicted RNA methylase
MEKRDTTQPKIKYQPSPEEIAEQIRGGEAPKDGELDRYLPIFLRYVSPQYWTPIRVGMQVGQWFREAGVRRVLDVGSGVGKFCVVGALSTECSFVGIEERENLVVAARELAHRFGVDQQVTFLWGVFGRMPLQPFDGYYFYNPFGENVFGPSDWLDENVEHSDERYVREISLTERFLESLPIGKYVVCYNGFGGRMPDGYKVVRSEPNAPNSLRMWQRTESIHNAYR